MKMKTRLLAMAAGLAISASAASSAWAVETEFVATGTVGSGGYDDGGFFGSAGVDLAGDKFIANFYIDTSKGSTDGASGSYQQSYGGIEDGATTTPIYATISINGITQELDGSYEAQADVFGGSLDYGQVDANVTQDGYSIFGSYFEELEVQINNSDASGFAYSFGQAFSVSSNNGSGSSNSGYLQLFNSNSGFYTVEYLSIDNISSPGIVDFASAAPEPAAWTLLIAGVGVAGAALRLGRRRGWTIA